MTASDRPVQDLIADAVLPDVAEHCTCQMFSNDGHRVNPPCSTVLTARRVAAAVVAACREATVEQQAQLTGAESVRAKWTRLGDSGRFVKVDGARLVGPWREDRS